MPVWNVLSSAISVLTSSAERAGKAAERIVTADMPKKAGGNSSLNV